MLREPYCILQVIVAFPVKFCDQLHRLNVFEKLMKIAVMLCYYEVVILLKISLAN